MRRFLPVLVLLICSSAMAEAPTSSLRPQPRPETPSQTAPLAPAGVKALTPAAAPATRPMPRPAGLGAAPAPTANAATPPKTVVPMITPKPRPAGLVALASAAPAAQAPAPKSNSKKKPKKGSVCGDSAIRGEALAAIPAKYKGCGLAEPVRVTMVSDVALNPAATISCETADALKQWIETGMRPAFGQREVVELRIAGSYTCRTRNNQKGAKISEHGRGKAIDIGGFVLSDGTTWTVTSNYNSTIRKAQKAACGIFGTTLGPGSDGFHEDHLHFDIARYNSGPYCR